MKGSWHVDCILVPGNVIRFGTISTAFGSHRRRFYKSGVDDLFVLYPGVWCSLTIELANF